ncbi:UxaA family hydrolase [Halopenitus sp. H-Gu1]|uniref:UxaA family hydrolase n=1 Tax=Halopenitus sp. H-Gu1 TaxID=3242697 RepID=UPI00359E8032
MSGADAPAHTFEGVQRADGAVGVRDTVLVLPSVICSHFVAERIADRVPTAIAAPHDHGCAQLGADSEQTRRTFLTLAQNPNVAGTVVVGLGCEEVQSDEVATALEEMDVPVRELSIQGVGGVDECIERGAEAATDLVEGHTATRSRSGIADLTVGIVSSDLDESTVAEADPLVGEVVDRVVDAGGRVVVAGNERIAAHPEAARAAADDETVEEAMSALIERHAQNPDRATRVGRAARDRTFEEATGSWGDRSISEVLEYGDQIGIDEGLAVVDAPSRFAEATTALAAAGANVVIHLTGDGVVAGHPILPVLKVTGDPETGEALSEDIDVLATETDADTFLDRILKVANGAECRAESHGITQFAITRVGPSM